MRIEKLIVKKTYPKDEEIRTILFKSKGLNLIVDDTKSNANESGNSVGKSTAIKIIDLCLGAKDVREIYYDSDTQSENIDIKEFLTINKVQAELVLFDSEQNKISLKRDLFPNGKRYIDDVLKNQNEYWDYLKVRLFDLQEPTPTFRQLIPKFVRLSTTSEDHMIKFLPSMTTIATYDTVYCFLFRLMQTDLVSKRDDINRRLVVCKNAISSLEKSKSLTSISMLRQKEELVQNDLKDCQAKRKEFSYMETYKEELEKNNNILTMIEKVQGEIQLLDFEIVTIEESIDKLSKSRSNIDMSTLEKIYKEAQGYIPGLQKEFQDVVSFHNSMIQNRIDFITVQLQKKQGLAKKYSMKMDSLLEKKKKITIDVLDEGLLAELNVLNQKIETLNFQKGEITQAIKLFEEQESLKNELQKELDEINAKADGTAIDNKLISFNKIFSQYCDRLYGEKYLLAYNQLWQQEKKFPITVGSLEGNVGTGKKKAVIVAFDLAYMQYTATEGIPSLQFVIHDKMENTHINQLKTIFELCQTIQGQYIIPILRERIDKVDAEIIDKATVLELSESDKFFRV